MANYVNPYNFVRLRKMDENARQTPVFHSQGSAGLFTGRFTCVLTSLSPFFIPYPAAEMRIQLPSSQPGKSKDFLKVNETFFHLGNVERPAIPGSTLKGLIRAVAEAAVNGCVSVFTPVFKTQKKSKLDSRDAIKMVDLLQFLTKFHLQPCSHLELDQAIPDSGLCPTCRLFGMPAVDEGTPIPGARPNAFASKVVIHDATWVSPEPPKRRETMLLTELSTPDATSYLYYDKDAQGHKRLRGRKFYYHNSRLLLDDQQTRANQLLEAYRNNNKNILTSYKPNDENLGRKSLVKPIDKNSQFEFEVEFHNLTELELGLLIYALELEPHPVQKGEQLTFSPSVYHKLGYGKPAGLGSVAIFISQMILLNEQERYNQPGTNWKDQDLSEKRSYKKNFLAVHEKTQNLADLKGILAWPNENTDVHYPRLQEFGEGKPQSYQLPPVGKEPHIKQENNR